MSDSTSNARPLSEQLKDNEGGAHAKHNHRAEGQHARTAAAGTTTATRTTQPVQDRDPHRDAVEERVNRERNEMEARNKDDGWFPVFLEWIPFAILTFIILTLLFGGMLLLDPEEPFPFFN